jgi:hypothetical protein
MENRNYQSYTEEQLVFIVKTFHRTNANVNTCRIFQEHVHQSIKRDTVANLIERFEATVLVKDLARAGRPSSICIEENKQVVEAVFSQSPQK